MSTTDLVIEFIDDVYRCSTDRPQMKFMSPECFEEVVVYYESLRDYLLNLELRTSNYGSTYADYLLSKGFGVGRFTTRYKESYPDSECRDDELFKAFSEFLIEYINCGRKASEGEEKGPGGA